MKTGKVTLVDTWYSGEDLYSDGQVEDEMLALARDWRAEEWNREIARRGSWPVLYHFSHVRENILNWLKLEGRGKVLEIGAGCGAVTGALCRQAERVDAVELSMKRSLINAYRHQDASNLTIYVGNFEEIEQHLDRDYDYITLIGVFEYAKAYIHDEDPYRKFLRTAAAHLAPGGRIVLAIENRFGLKYWAGCTEDHTGVLFEGLQGYREDKGVCTFTKGQLTGIVSGAGLKASWYYPYPDYKFPEVIHSDRRLPAKGELPARNYNFDRLRLRLFDEAAVLDSVIESGLYPEFANSFLLVLESEENEKSRSLPVYAKFSNERSPRFAMMTTIEEDGDASGSGLAVLKEALSPAADAHTAGMARNQHRLDRLLRRGSFKAVPCTLQSPASPAVVRLEYVSGTTLEERLDAALSSGCAKEAEELLVSCARRIRTAFSDGPFEASKEFADLFGSPDLPDGLYGAAPCDIDIVPANIMQTKDGDLILDTEWTFDFQIPADYVVYRFVWYYLQADPKRAVLDTEAVLEKAGLTSELTAVFSGMEKSFQASLLTGFVPMRDMYERISPGQAEISGYFGQLRAGRERRTLQVFYDRGEGFAETDCVWLQLGAEQISIPLPPGTRALRLDPGEEPGLFRLKDFAWDGVIPARFVTNGFDMGEGKYYFLKRDPQILLDDIPPQAAVLEAGITCLKSESETADFAAWLPGHEAETQERITRLELEKASLEAELLQQSAQLTQARQLIREMEGTKAWRLYKRLRKLIPGKAGG